MRLRDSTSSAYARDFTWRGFSAILEKILAYATALTQCRQCQSSPGVVVVLTAAPESLSRMYRVHSQPLLKHIKNSKY